MHVLSIVDEIISGRRLKRGDDISFLLTADISEITEGADKIRKSLCGDKGELCSIINGKSGRCSEDCKFCGQSGCHKTKVNEYDFLDEAEILRECKHNEENGVNRFSIVTAGRTLSKTDFAKAVSAYRKLRDNCKIKLCASHGLLTDEQFRELRETGVTRYHCNIETSRRNFPNICTTHTFDDKIECIKRAKKNGLDVCSGGIIGMGETWEDRIDMAFTLAELEIRSIPVNILNALEGTPFENMPKLENDDILRTIAIFRYINPTADIRLAGGRIHFGDMGERALRSGANTSITGDMLTTSGFSIDTDKKLFKSVGYEL